MATGAVGKEEFNHVTTAARGRQEQRWPRPQSAAVAAREQLSSNQSLTEGIAVDQHPNVLRAAARVREAYLALRRAELLAPVDGYVAKRSVQLGQRVQAGTPLMADRAAERGLGRRQLQGSASCATCASASRSTLTADVYGKKVEYHGTIEGLGAGTGAAFALLPAQNATGNWIKVVQRVPVRIALDPKELEDHPLRVGLSMDAKVDVSKTDGQMLADGTRDQRRRSQTNVFDERERSAPMPKCSKIIAANVGRGGDAPTRRREPPARGASRPARRRQRLGASSRSRD